jgi:hypothetical protein
MFNGLVWVGAGRGCFGGWMHGNSNTCCCGHGRGEILIVRYVALMVDGE